jgi:predicted porin
LKKSLLAAAVLSALAGTALAQTNVTIYGVIDAGISHENNGGPAGSVTRMDSGVLNGSRLGFKGSEDLGGGLSAIFNLENGFSTDTGNMGQGALFGRQAWVGLNGGFGSVKLGRQSTVIYANSGTFDPFGDTLAGDSARLFNYYGSRTNNTVSYGYAAHGWRGELDYSFGEVAGDNAASRTMAGFVGYNAGPIDVVLAYHTVKNATATDSAKTTLLGGNYNFGIVKAYASYAWNKGFAGLDTRDALLGLKAPVGTAGTVMASIIRKTDKQRADADATQLALGYTHDLSKRTALYSSVSRTTNDNAVAYNAGANGATDTLFNVGVRHKF